MSDRPIPPPVPPVPTRVKLLRDAERLTTQDRNNTYGNFTDNLVLQGQIMGLLLGAGLSKYTTAHNVAIGFAIGKLSRMASGTLHEDNYTDAINYIAAAFEAQKALTVQEGETQQCLKFSAF